MIVRRRLLVAALACGAAILATSAAWACSVMARTPIMTGVEQREGASVTVTGKWFEPGLVSVWFGDDVRGPTTQLAVAEAHHTTNPDTDGWFEAVVTIPEVPSGMYALFGRQGSVVEPLPIYWAPSGTVTTATGGNTQPTSTEGSASAGSLLPTTAPTAAPAAASARPAGSSAGNATAGVATAPSGQATEIGDSTSAAGNGQPGVAQVVPGPSGLTAAAPLPARTATGEGLSSRSFGRDLWSGFTTGSGAGLPGTSLVGLPQSSGGTPGMTLGIGMAMGATLALVTGFGLSEARRRKALA